MIYEFDGLTSWIGFAQPVHTMSETFFLPIIYRKLKFYELRFTSLLPSWRGLSAQDQARTLEAGHGDAEQDGIEDE